ncbi:MAG TPA: class I SAM-dependent rRNA methyltransferase [Gammaproteobacteria bacterium]|nr:class I SAM-dependent rRNA methyltransferase [Gammaproteobacteria bacterium]
MYPTLRLNPKADYRLRNGHVWIYSNEIDNSLHDLKKLTPGQLAIIENAAGKALGVAYVNPNTLICGRLLDADPNTPIDKEFFLKRIKHALTLRDQLFTQPYYRLIYGESDLLPGLVVDRFAKTLVVQIATAGMDQYLELTVAALDQLVNPDTIIVKNDGKMREVEGLESYVKFYKGQETPNVQLEENGVQFIAPILQGQKTGWFYDHRMTRARLAVYVKNKRVLDVFSYIGGWGIQAAAAGAKEVICTDISKFALDYVMQNAKLNNLSNVSSIEGDAFDVMQNLYDSGERFDVVILDPPAFIPRRKDVPKGTAAYQKANLMALRLLSPQGVLISGSCSLHLPAGELRNVIHKAGVKLNRQLQILEQGHQGPDHPIHPAIAETEYLKSLIVAAQ